MDIEWAIEELDRFLALTELYRPPTPSGAAVISSRLSNRGAPKEITESAEVVEKILDRSIPGWRDTITSELNKYNRWSQHIEAAQRARVALLRREEIAQKLGEDAPDLNAAALHPWAWEGAKSLWASGHYREAIGAAARKINAETQNKVNRKDVSETDLFKQCFSLSDPQPGKPRLRVMSNDGSKTFESLHRGVMAFADGCYSAIRNPGAHLDGQDELSESEALEQLATFSVLARWVDSASVETAL